MTSQDKCILITGTNSGLGLGICRRLIDDFLQTQPPSYSLTLLFTTRSTQKGKDTLAVLQAYLAKHRVPNAHDRIHLRPENVELTDLLSVKALARKLLASDLVKLDAIVLNAGIAGCSGMNWPMTLGTIAYDIRTNTTWPRFKLGIIGLITQDQFSDTVTKQSEPPLGQIFCANIFGHYMLTHWLMPLLQACEPEEPAKIIWISSIEPQAKHFNERDLQAITSKAAYEHTKRLEDILALNYSQPESSNSTMSYTKVSSTLSAQPRPSRSIPTMHVAQPGITTTTIIALYWIVQQCYYIGILLARVVGSPWATVSTYTSAMSITWLLLMPATELRKKESQYGGDISDTKSQDVGHVKWGTAVTRWGTPSAKPTEVEGWGLYGNGESYVNTWWAGKLGRAPGAKEATKEDVEEFRALGSRVWGEMEELREQWEARIEDYEKSKQT